MTQKPDVKIGHGGLSIEGLSGELEKLEVSEKTENVGINTGQKVDNPKKASKSDVDKGDVDKSDVDKIEADKSEVDKSLGENSASTDATTFKLLDLLNEYETLANDSFRVNFTNGFLDLSRANYYGSQRFGMDSIDMRPRDASTIVELSEGRPTVKDKWMLYKTTSKSGKDKNPKKDKDGNGKDPKKGGNEKDPKSGNKVPKAKDESSETKTEDVVASASATDSSQELRNRTKKASDPKETTKEIRCTEETSLTEDDELTPPSDPLYQFGRMVPPQLRAAQGHFQKALSDSIQLLYLQQEIVSIVSALQQSK